MTEQTRVLAAFRPEWERLGIVASRLGHSHGNRIVQAAQALRDAGSVESKFNGMCLSWRRVAPLEHPQPDPIGVTPYCPPVELEGPDSGLVEQLAERLWRNRSPAARPTRIGHWITWANQSDAVKTSWRATAFDALQMMFDLGFVGPAGEPRQDRFEGLTYCWNYIATEWQINDAEGGYVALVRETPDLEIMLAGPAMRTAIRDLFSFIPDDHPSLAIPQMAALRQSLPESQIIKGKQS